MQAIKLSLGDYLYRLIEVPFKVEGKFTTSNIKGCDYERIEIDELSRDRDRGIILVNKKYPLPERSEIPATNPLKKDFQEWYITEDEVKELVTGMNKACAKMLEDEINQLMTISESLTKLSQPKNFK